MKNEKNPYQLGVFSKNLTDMIKNLLVTDNDKAYLIMFANHFKTDGPGYAVTFNKLLGACQDKSQDLIEFLMSQSNAPQQAKDFFMNKFGSLLKGKSVADAEKMVKDFDADYKTDLGNTWLMYAVDAINTNDAQLPVRQVMSAIKKFSMSSLNHVEVPVLKPVSAESFKANMTSPAKTVETDNTSTAKTAVNDDTSTAKTAETDGNSTSSWVGSIKSALGFGS